MNGKRSMRTVVLAGLASLLVIAAVVAVVMLVSGDRKAGTSSRLGGRLTAGTAAGLAGATTVGDSGSPEGDPVAGSPSSTSGSSTSSPSGSSIPGTTPDSTTPPPVSSSPPGPATSSPPAPAASSPPPPPASSPPPPASSPPAPAVPGSIWLTDFSGGGVGSLSQSSGTFPLAPGGRLRLHMNVARIHLDQPMDCWVRIRTEGGGYEIATFTNTQNVSPSYTNPTSGTAYLSVGTTNCMFDLTLSHEF